MPAIHRDDAVVGIEPLFIPQIAAQLGIQDRVVLGNDMPQQQLHRGFEFARRIAENAERILVPHQLVAARPAFGETDAGVAPDGTQPRFRMIQRRAHVLFGRDVARRDKGEFLALMYEAADVERDGKLAAVLAPVPAFNLECAGLA